MKTPEFWSLLRLSDISNMKSGMTITSRDISESGIYPCYGGNGLRGYTSVYTHEGDYALVGRQGALCGNVQYVSGRFFASEHAVVVTPQKSTDINWLYHVLKSMNLNQYSESSAQPGLSVLKLLNLTVIVPKKSEQTAIASVLSDTDALIENLEKLIAKKRNIKQGVMQELLTGRKRLEGFNGEWDKIKIGEVADIHKGNGLSKTKLKSEGKYGCILYGELFTTYKRIIKNAISRTDYEEGVYSRAGDILMPGSTTTTGIDLAIASAVLKDNILLGGDINVIRPKTASINSIFLTYYITEILKHKILELTQGITIIHLYGKDLKTLEIAIPEISEQNEIAKFLVDIDEELSGLENQMNKYQLIKQGMMQTLLTGKIRLV